MLTQVALPSSCDLAALQKRKQWARVAPELLHTRFTANMWTSGVTDLTDRDTLPHFVSKDAYFYHLRPSRTNYSHTKTHPVCRSFHAALPHTYRSLSCQIIRLRGVLNHLAYRDKSPRDNALVGHRGAVKKKNQCFYWPWLAVRPCPVLYDSACLFCHSWCLSDCAVTDGAHWPIRR